MRLSARSERSRIHHAAIWAPCSLVVAVVVGLASLVGCSSSSSTADYCTARTNLENSVKGLTSLNASSGVSGLQTQVSKVKSDATTLVNEAKGDFPTETAAITSSVNALQNSVKALASSPSAAQIATVTKDAGSVVSSVNNFMTASKSKCSS
jgi:hypothetical protein